MSPKHRSVEVIARGVLISGGKVLLCHSKGAANTYLPGGHVEFGEPAREALARELMEESGRRMRVGAFLGCIEHSFVQKGERHCEINLVFELQSAASPEREIPAEEDWIEFMWASVADLDSARLEPAPVRGVIRKLAESSSVVPSFRSTYAKSG